MNPGSGYKPIQYPNKNWPVLKHDGTLTFKNTVTFTGQIKQNNNGKHNIRFSGSTVKVHGNNNSQNKGYAFELSGTQTIKSKFIKKHTTPNSPNLNINSGTIRTVVSRRSAKDNITPVSEALALKILDLQPVSFNYLIPEDEGGGVGSEDILGLIAEDVSATNPILCTYNEETNEPEGVEYERVGIPVLKLMQLQHTRLETLEARLSALEGGN